MIVRHFEAVFDLVVFSIDFFEREKERDSIMDNEVLTKISQKNALSNLCDHACRCILMVNLCPLIN